MSWETYKGVDYIYLDYRGLSDLGIMELTLDFADVLKHSSDNSLRLIIDVSGVTATFQNYTKIKDIGKFAQPKMYKSVYVGLNTYSKIFFKMYKKFTNTEAILLDNLDEAKEYVIT